MFVARSRNASSQTSQCRGAKRSSSRFGATSVSWKRRASHGWRKTDAVETSSSPSPFAFSLQRWVRRRCPFSGRLNHVPENDPRREKQEPEHETNDAHDIVAPAGFYWDELLFWEHDAAKE